MNRKLARFSYLAICVLIFFSSIHFYKEKVGRNEEGLEVAENMNIRVSEFHGVYDKSGKNVIIKNVKLADDQPMKHDVTVATQLDGTRIENVIKMAERWKGPIHATVVIASTSLWNLTMDIVENIRSCKIEVRKHVTWHILIMMHSSQNQTIYFYKSRENPSKYAQKRVRIESCIYELKDKIYELQSGMIRLGPPGTSKHLIAHYPQSIAMNVALTSVTTDFLIALDGEVYPSINARHGFIEMGEKLNLFDLAEMPPPYKKLEKWPGSENDKKQICSAHKYLKHPPHDLYVLPTFEVSHRLPPDVAKLKKDYSIKKARPFYIASGSSIYGQTDHKRWLEVSDGGPVECAYEVEYIQNYEPFFIARRGVALFNETFIGHSQVDVHHVALLAAIGYRFKVLKNAFLIHEGFKSPQPVTGQKYKEAMEFWATWEAYLINLDKTYRQRQ